MFRECITTDKLNNCLGVVRSHAVEANIPINKVFNVEGTQYENLKYMCSISRNGIVRLNFFTYGQSGHLGLAVSRTGSDDIIAVLEENYISFQIFHTNLWACTRSDGVGEIIAHNRVVVSNVIDIDVFGITGSIHFIKIESSDACALICVDLQDLIKGLYSPKGLDDFKEYFWDKLVKYGYSGAFDRFPLSHILEQYYSVNNLCFERHDYVKLDV